MYLYLILIVIMFGGLIYILEHMKVKNVVIGIQYENSSQYEKVINIIKEKEIKTVIENYKYYNASIEDTYIPDTRHLPQMEAPDEMLEQLRMFL